MPKETATIRTVRYRDNDGKATCALNFKTGEFCEFHRVARFGTVDTCLFAPKDHRGRNRLLNRRGKSGLGLLVPGDWCPLFNKGN